MTELMLALGALGLAYLLGAVPFGFILVMLRTGQDIREIQSGRTGGTNAMRAAGFWTGLATGILDILKGYWAVSIARAFVPENELVWALAPVMAVIGHNYSIYMINVKNGKVRLGGGAGGATVLGGAMGLWPASFLIIFPIGIAIFYFIGYASVTTMSLGVMSLLVFGWRSYSMGEPWEYMLFGALSIALLVYALRPNLKALRAGTERLHGFRARGKKKAEA